MTADRPERPDLTDLTLADRPAEPPGLTGLTEPALAGLFQAAAIVLAGASAASAAVLPAPVQHTAFRLLSSIGVPDTQDRSGEDRAGRRGRD